MKQLTGNQTRALFLEYFKQHGHMVEPSASLVPHNDPTLLWINAGVAALKKYFDGREKPQCPRITNAQKSIRTNDIENVGKTARHHTFFEMLGNFSIGDYFKEEAIAFAWEFLTSDQWIGFDKDKLYITVYIDDEVAYNRWIELGVDPSHILKTANNYWEIGEGPSGPDSEIFYDRGEAYDPNHEGETLFFEEKDNDRYIEVWNVVFSQYDAKEGVDRKDYKELPQKNIDTGMGLERLVSIIQNGETNFDTDLFLPMIHETEKIAQYPYEGEFKMAYRVIADHIRTVTFAIADGAMPSNEGRGYIIRRVLRRAVRFALKLGITKPFMCDLVDTVVENYKDYYPYLIEKADLIKKIVRNEEESFSKTLINGERLLDEQIAQLGDNKVLDGEVAFKLYDTYGFPKELIHEICEDNGICVDEDGFKAMMEQQKQRARDSRLDAQSMHNQSKDLMDFIGESCFVGYETFSSQGKVIALFKDGVACDSLDSEGEVILDVTPFYGESGGQVGDHGRLSNDTFKANVIDTKKAPHGQHLSKIKVTNGVLTVGDNVNAQVNVLERKHIRANHTSLHLLQAALIKVLGTHIAQAGSFVCADYARFDFSHFEKVTKDQIKEIEALVNQWIDEEYDVTTEVMNVEQAKNSGAIALFDEKYGDNVRVVTMGNVSKELCGGTHVSNTALLGAFKILSEESIGSGVRRITVVTKAGAINAFKHTSDVLETVGNAIGAKNEEDNIDKVNRLLANLEQLNHKLADIENQRKNALANQLIASKTNVGELETIVAKVDVDASGLKSLATQLMKQLTNGYVGLVSVSDDKLSIVVGCSDALITSGKKAGDIVKQAALLADGKGGGKPDMAQAGAKDTTKVSEVLNYLNSVVA